VQCCHHWLPPLKKKFESGTTYRSRNTTLSGAIAELSGVFAPEIQTNVNILHGMLESLFFVESNFLTENFQVSMKSIQ
jgi:hypothetical protein